MKVLVVSNGYPPRGRWGTEFYTQELVEGLLGRGNEVVVLHPQRDGSQPRFTTERVDAGGVPVVLLHNPGDPGKAFRDSYENARVEEVFRDVLREVRPDVVHFTYLLWGLSVGLPSVAAREGVPSVATLTDYGLLCHRGQMFDWRLRACGGPHPPAVCARCIREPSRSDLPPLSRAVKALAVRALGAIGGAGRVVVTRDLEARERAVARTFEAVDTWIAPTAYLREVFVRAGVPAGRIVHLVYSFAEGPYGPLAGPRPRERVRFAYFGQFAPHKGLHVLAEAVRRLRARRPDDDWELVLHGAPSEGRHGAYSAACLAALDGERVRRGELFPPQRAPAVLAEVSAVLVPSLWDENAPLAALQARAAGVPVIGSNVPGIREVVVDGLHGRLVEPGDPEELARALAAFLDGRVAPMDAVGLPLSLARHLERIERIYADAVARKPASDVD